MHDEADYPIDLFAMANVASQSEGLIQAPDAGPRSFQSAGIARQQHNLRTVTDEEIYDRFADSHRSTGDNYYFSRNFFFCEIGRSHAGFVPCLAGQVKTRLQSID
jgi:hypothetical protein